MESSDSSLGILECPCVCGLPTAVLVSVWNGRLVIIREWLKTGFINGLCTVLWGL